MADEGDSSISGPATVKDRVDQVLREDLMVLPGAQALLGFQFIAMLTESFDKLPRSLQYAHLGSLALVALATVLMLTPAAYHRIVERGDDTEHFVRLASRFLLTAMAVLALGIAGDVYVVTRKMSESNPVALACAGLALAGSYGLWFGFTLLARERQATRAGEREMLRAEDSRRPASP
jgi:hypothetical protein